MNIFGVGSTELILILVIMLMVAGPKRMARWAYVIGIYVGKLREMWGETSAVLKKELADAGIEPDIVDSFGKVANPKTRRTAVSGQLDKLVGDMKKPIEESLKPVEEALKPVETTLKEATSAPLNPTPAKPVSAAEQPAPEKDSASDTDNSTGQYDAWTAS